MNSGIEQLMDDLAMEVRYTRRHIGKDALSPRVMEAMREVPRERFVPAGMAAMAFANGPLPIGHGQTISQPYIVALMTDLVRPKPEGRYLEVGTGSGYQAAVLSRLVARVYSLEIIPSLADSARRRLADLGYDNVTVRCGDGHEGWPEHAPYDGILVTAAARTVPERLLAQLKPGAPLVIPTGPPHMGQDLMVLERDEAGEVTFREVLPVAFVPLTGGSTDA